MKLTLTSPGGWFKPENKFHVETTEIAAMSVNDESHTVITLRSGKEFVCLESVETVEKLCAEMMKQATKTVDPAT